MDSQEKALLQQSTLEDPAKKAYATKQEAVSYTHLTLPTKA